MLVRCIHDLYPTTSDVIPAGTDGTIVEHSDAHTPVSVTCKFLYGAEQDQEHVVTLPLDVVSFPEGGFADIINLFIGNSAFVKAEFADPQEDFEFFGSSPSLRRQRRIRFKFASGFNILITSDRNTGGFLFEVETT